MYQKRSVNNMGDILIQFKLDGYNTHKVLYSFKYVISLNNL